MGTGCSSCRVKTDARADADESGRPARFDYEYQRNGTANLFMCLFRARKAAPCQGHRSPYRHGLRSRSERLGRHPLRTCQIDRSGPRQSQHPTVRLHSTKPFRRSKPGAWSSASNGTALQNTEVASIWPSSQLGRLNDPSASIAAFPTNRHSSTKSPPGRYDRNANHTKADWQFTTSDKNRVCTSLLERRPGNAVYAGFIVELPDLVVGAHSSVCGAAALISGSKVEFPRAHQ